MNKTDASQRGNIPYLFLIWVGAVVVMCFWPSLVLDRPFSRPRTNSVERSPKKRCCFVVVGVQGATTCTWTSSLDIQLFNRL